MVDFSDIMGKIIQAEEQKPATLEEYEDAGKSEEKEVQGKKIIRIIIRGTNGRE